MVVHTEIQEIRAVVSEARAKIMNIVRTRIAIVRRRAAGEGGIRF